MGKQQTLLKQAQQHGSPYATPTAPFSRPAPKRSMQPMLVSQCMTDKSVERESFLASLLQCEVAIKAARCRPPINGPNAFDNHPLDIIDRLFKKGRILQRGAGDRLHLVAKSA
ncbi:secreted protein [Klebsiella pneumoniae]|uniref:Secreted protein n=1 Tax=Klebsiella pneumoniae TaxID=573 RepID=A0A378F6T2_KLEPN|nr:secreted protein [Klebsiella pneumoniae]